MSPADLYDCMLKAVQQFPLETFLFEKKTRRIHKKAVIARRKYLHVLATTPPPDDPRLARATARLERLLVQKEEAATALLRVVRRHLQILQDFTQSRPGILAISPCAPSSPALLNVPASTASSTPSCICQTPPHGLMVRCARPECTVRWYHLACAELSAAPVVEWTCRRCQEGW